MPIILTVGPIAQRLELPAHNRLVGGSNPSGPTNSGAVVGGAMGGAVFAQPGGRLLPDAWDDLWGHGVTTIQIGPTGVTA